MTRTYWLVMAIVGVSGLISVIRLSGRTTQMAANADSVEESRQTASYGPTPGPVANTVVRIAAALELEDMSEEQVISDMTWFQAQRKKAGLPPRVYASPGNPLRDSAQATLRASKPTILVTSRERPSYIAFA